MLVHNLHVGYFGTTFKYPNFNHLWATFWPFRGLFMVETFSVAEKLKVDKLLSLSTNIAH